MKTNYIHPGVTTRRREQVVVHFAGGGGSCTGIANALGRSPNHAVNHDSAALGMHRANHPGTRHHIEDVFDVDPAPIIQQDGPVGLAWFSPSCTHFSKAKGGQPLDARIRGLTLVMLRWAKAGTRLMFMENVEEIRTWGPLVKMVKNKIPGWYPDPQARGRTWQAFLDCMGDGISPDHPDLPFFAEVLAGQVHVDEMIKGFGYKFEARELRACDYGTPTIRKRLYAVFRNDGRPIVWPNPTHADPATLQPGDTRRPWHTMAECVDWERPCPSIFLRGQAAKKARCKRPLADATLARIARGIDKYVLNNTRPFIVSLTHQGGDRVESIDLPANTITAAHRGEKALVSAVVTECANASSKRNMPVDEPMRTACAHVKGGHFALVTASVMTNTTGHSGADAQAPLPTIATGGHHALVATSMVKLRGTNTGDAVDTPMHTASAGGTHHGLVAASLVQTGYGEREGQEPRALDIEKPLGTVVAGGGKHALVAAYVAQHNGGFNVVDGKPLDSPVSTINTTGSQQTLVAASVMAYYGTEADGQHVNDPARTVTTKSRMGLVNSELVPTMTEATRRDALRVAKFLRSYGVEFEGEFATVQGLAIVDIGLRMFTPRELFRASGFPEGYIINQAIYREPTTGMTVVRELTKEEQIRMCGNAVCPPVAEALVRSNAPEMVHAG
jgi:DNA (cytosine-5)-methyltransferase 1